MKKSFLFLSLFALSVTQLLAQDILLFTNGDEQEVKITEVSSQEVKYKRMNNLEGPTFSTLKSELFMIKYANGDKDVIEHASTAQTESQKSGQQYSTAPASGNNSSASSGQLSSAVSVVDNTATARSKPKTDEFGRTREENLRLKRKRIVGGAVSMGVGGFFLIGSIPLLYVGGNNDIPGLIGAGAICLAGGGAALITGAVLLGKSKKYGRRAEQLAASNLRLSPAILNQTTYVGARINQQTGYGVSLSLNF